MQNLGVECDRLKVRRYSTESGVSPILVIAGSIGILGLLLAASATTSDIPITTGILGGRVIAVKRRSLK